MKAVLISIRPQWCEKIASGKKTVEVRKSRPRLTPPFRCYIYCSMPKTKDPRQILEIHGVDGKIRKANGKVIGEFICDRLFPISVFDNGSIQNWNYENMEESCLTYEELANYIGNDKTGYGWRISNLYIYDTPQYLSRFKKPCKNEADCCVCPHFDYSIMDCVGRMITYPPQSWCYVEEVSL